MLSALRKFFSPPVFEDGDKSRAARILNIILWAGLFLLILIRWLAILGDKNWIPRLLNPISFLILILVGLIIAMKLGYIQQTSFLLLVAVWAALSFQAYSSGGIYDSAYLATISVVLLAGLLLDFRYSILFTVLAIGAGWGLAYLQTIGSITVSIDKPLNFARDLSAVFVLLTILSYLIISGLSKALAATRENEHKQIKANHELLELQTFLEERVKERTVALEQNSLQLEHRAVQLEAIADISGAVTAINDFDELLPIVARLICDRFKLYHVGIYLLTEDKNWLILSAASGQNSQQMLETNLKLPVESTSMCGYVASRGQPRIALDVSQDQTYRELSDLPATQSEAALPLMAGTRLLGVLDLQSSAHHTFREEDLNFLTTLSNQVALSMQNAQSFSETRRALQEADRIYQQFVAQGWKSISSDLRYQGYKYSREGLAPLEEADLPQPITPSMLTIPIKLRGQTIGAMNIRATDKKQSWDTDEMAIIQAAADRAALALENARLLKESQRRAAKERVIGEISAKISETASIDGILQTAVQELYYAVPGCDISIQVAVAGEEDPA
jgi:GAF domain-containing protein